MDNNVWFEYIRKIKDRLFQKTIDALTFLIESNEDKEKIWKDIAVLHSYSDVKKDNSNIGDPILKGRRVIKIEAKPWSLLAEIKALEKKYPKLEVSLKVNTPEDCFLEKEKYVFKEYHNSGSIPYTHILGVMKEKKFQ